MGIEESAESSTAPVIDFSLPDDKQNVEPAAEMPDETTRCRTKAQEAGCEVLELLF